MFERVACFPLSCLFFIATFFAVFFAPTAKAQECRGYYKSADKVCSQMFDQSQDFTVGEGHFATYQKSEMIFNRVAYIHKACRKAIEDCERECGRFALAEEAFMGETPSVMLSQIQTRRCGEGGVLYQKAEALQELTEVTRNMYEQAKANYILTEASSGRAPAQSYPTSVMPPAEHFQTVPESVYYNTNPVEYQKQIEEALGHVK